MDNVPVYMTIQKASIYTGLAESYIRRGVKSGYIPHIMSGTKYLVNIPRLLEKLESEASNE